MHRELSPDEILHLYNGRNGSAYPFETFEPDADLDGIPDDVDNCVFTPNVGQWDFDEDGVGDWCDNCILKANPDQLDSDGNDKGDACEHCTFTWRTLCTGSLWG